MSIAPKEFLPAQGEACRSLVKPWGRVVEGNHREFSSGVQQL